ncbi:STAS domain-containing protein [Lentzea sp. NPDC005914]|uniref:STAS domain-containing protein n=1 Tax=Lentzea sp. NPDC005914 TaxID=3154572 RepID=UPI0033F757D6
MSDREERPQLAQAKAFADNGVVVVTLTGEVDMVNAEEMRSALQAQLDARPDVLVVDLALDFLGSAGLMMLIQIHRSAEQGGSRFGVVASSRPAWRPLELSGLANVLPLFDSAPEAVKSLRTGD